MIQDRPRPSYPLPRIWLLLPLLLWAPVTLVVGTVVASPGGLQLFFGNHWVPWGWLLLPAFLIPLGTAALGWERLEDLRRKGYGLSLGLWVLCCTFIWAGCRGCLQGFPQGTRLEEAKQPADALDLREVDLGQGLRLAYSPWIPVDRGRASLPAQKTPQPASLQGADLPGPLTGQPLQNVVAFARAYGHLRFYQPTDAANQSDWERLAIAGIPYVAGARDPLELQSRLRAFFGCFAPRAQFLRAGESPAPLTVPSETAFFIRAVHESAYDFSHYMRPHQGPERATRVAAVVVAWNLFHHFAPSLENALPAWDAALLQGLEHVSAARDKESYLVAFQHFAAHARDGHCFPQLEGCDPQAYGLPLAITQAEGRAFVVRVQAGLDPRLTPGCEILALGDEPAGARLSRLAAQVSPSTPNHVLRGADVLFAGVPDETPRTLSWRTPQGATLSTSVRGSRTWVLPRAPEAAVRDLAPGLLYLDLTSSLPEAGVLLARIHQAKALIVDLRGTPSSDFCQTLLPCLIQTPIWRPQVSWPVTRGPERHTWTWTSRPDRQVPHGKPFTGKVAFLMNGETLSFAEHMLGMVAQTGRGVLVGEGTGGTDGVASDMTLPGGLSLGWTPMRAHLPDGSPLNQVGLRPTFPCTPTVPGLTAARDEVLDTAIRAVTGHEGSGGSPARAPGA